MNDLTPTRTIHTKVLDDIRGLVENAGLEAIDEPLSANAGKLSLQDTDAVGEIGCVGYEFGVDAFTLSLAFDGTAVLSPSPRDGCFDFYMKHTDIGRYTQFRAALIANLNSR